MNRTAYVYVDDSAVEEKFNGITRKAKSILAKAANSALADMREKAVDSVVKRYHLKKGETQKLVDTSRKNRATVAKPTAAFIVRQERRPNLFKYKISPRKVVRRTEKRKQPTPRVYKASVLKAGGAKPLDGNPFKPFVAKMKENNVTGVFVRTNEPSLQNPKVAKIKAVFGPDVPALTGSRYVLPDRRQEAERQMAEKIVEGLEKA